MHWQQDDAVWIGGATYTAASGGSTTTTLTGTGAEKESGSGLYKAYYPASLCQTNGSSMTLTLPAVQDYSEPVGGKLVADQFPMYAQSSGTDLTFHNLCAVLAVPLKGTHTVKEVVVSSGETGPWLSGPFNVEADGDGFKAVITGGTGSSRTVTLDCGTAGVTLSATAETIFCIALPEASYEPGSLVVEAKDADGNVLARHTNASRATASLLECSKIYQPEAMTTQITPYFTVSKGKRVRFAPGNVQYKASTKTWRFAEHQWDCVGGIDPYGRQYGTVYEDGLMSDNTQVGETYAGWIDVFGWATAGVQNQNGGAYGYDEYHKRYLPYQTDTTRNITFNYTGYGPSTNGTDMTVTTLRWAQKGAPTISAGAEAYLPYDVVIGNNWNAVETVKLYCDWGVHFNAAGEGLDSRTDGTWYTLSAYEWEYVFKSRPQADLLYGAGRIKVDCGTLDGYLSGTILLPDNWECPAGISFEPGYGFLYTTNSYSVEQWEVMENAGAVFLPHGGFRHEFEDFMDFGNTGHYWSSSAWASGSNANGFYAYQTFLPLADGFPSVVVSSARYYGLLVRLVHDI